MKLMKHFAFATMAIFSAASLIATVHAETTSAVVVTTEASTFIAGTDNCFHYNGNPMFKDVITMGKYLKASQSAVESLLDANPDMDLLNAFKLIHDGCSAVLARQSKQSGKSLQ